MNLRNQVDLIYKLVKKQKDGANIYEIAYWIDRSPTTVIRLVKILVKVYPCELDNEMVRCQDNA